MTDSPDLKPVTPNKAENKEGKPLENATFPKKLRRTTVRFSESEYIRIKKEAHLSGESLPLLLKQSFFRGKKLKLLFDEETRHWVCRELRRIGTNVNQIARKVNSGALEGWHSEFEKVVESISDLQRLASEAYGNR